MKVLVTGASGFVGKYLIRELLDSGHMVMACDAREPRDTDFREVSSFPGKVSFERCDLRQMESVSELIRSSRPDSIVHLAAQSSAAISIEKPRETLETNILCALNLLEAVRNIERPAAHGGRAFTRVRILSIGSAEEYGAKSPNEMPLKENASIEPLSPYAISKATQTMMALRYASLYGMDVIATRSFPHTGPGQSRRFVLPAFASQCAEIAAGMKADGVKVGRLDVVRDYMDVRDTVRAYRLILERGKSGSVYNVCSGEGLSLKRALDFFIRSAGTEVTVEEDSSLLRPVDIPILVGDAGKLRAEVGFERLLSIERMLGDLFSHWLGVSRGVSDV